MPTPFPGSDFSRPPLADDREARARSANTLRMWLRALFTMGLLALAIHGKRFLQAPPSARPVTQDFSVAWPADAPQNNAVKAQGELEEQVWGNSPPPPGREEEKRPAGTDGNGAERKEQPAQASKENVWRELPVGREGQANPQGAIRAELDAARSNLDAARSNLAQARHNLSRDRRSPEATRRYEAAIRTYREAAAAYRAASRAYQEATRGGSPGREKVGSDLNLR